jgi:hypothetical protein
MKWIRSEENPATIQNAARAAVAGGADARGVLGGNIHADCNAVHMGGGVASLRTSSRGNGAGCRIGALVATHYMDNPLAFGVGVFAIGILCAGISADRAAYRYASITLAIVMLIAHKDSAWITALHRFIEVSVGLAVGRQRISPRQKGNFSANA